MLLLATISSCGRAKPACKGTPSPSLVAAVGFPQSPITSFTMARCGGRFAPPGPNEIVETLLVYPQPVPPGCKVLGRKTWSAYNPRVFSLVAEVAGPELASGGKFTGSVVTCERWDAAGAPGIQALSAGPVLLVWTRRKLP